MGVNPYYRSDRDAAEKRQRDAAAKRRAAAEYSRAQANAPETIPPTGKHHRKDGK